jgi:glycolate oxidase FAD binding subunit
MEGGGELTLSELCEVVRGADRLKFAGDGSRSAWLPHWEGPVVRAPSGIIAHDVPDQVVQAWAGTRVRDLQSELAAHGQCLPLATDVPEAYSQRFGTLGGLVATNLPHALVAQCGSVRDWVIGMTVVRADGTLAKCGSKAVKSVAGYDVHRFFVGSRGTLGAIASVTLRTLPTKALPAHGLELNNETEPRYVARTLRTDFDQIVSAANGLTAFDRASCTLWTTERPDLPATAWMLGPSGEMVREPQPTKFESHARQVFDPHGKFAPGWRT